MALSMLNINSPKSKVLAGFLGSVSMFLIIWYTPGRDKTESQALAVSCQSSMLRRITINLLGFHDLTYRISNEVMLIY